MIENLFGNIPILVTDAVPPDEIRLLTPEEMQAFAEYFKILCLFGKITHTVEKLNGDEYLHTFTFEV